VPSSSVNKQIGCTSRVGVFLGPRDTDAVTAVTRKGEHEKI
jgi:hypothetical protein